MLLKNFVHCRNTSLGSGFAALGASEYPGMLKVVV
jgi:hypothetical protein